MTSKYTYLPVADYRNTTERLFRQAIVHYSACVGNDERASGVVSPLWRWKLQRISTASVQLSVTGEIFFLPGSVCRNALTACCLPGRYVMDNVTMIDMQPVPFGWFF